MTAVYFNIWRPLKPDFFILHLLSLPQSDTDDEDGQESEEAEDEDGDDASRAVEHPNIDASVGF